MEKSTEEKRKRLILIRHGQTEFNIQGRVQGWCDSPLTETGRQQMEAAGQALSRRLGHKPEMIFSSDLGRAVESASIVAPEAKHYVMQALREYSFGDFDGKPADQLPDWDELPAHGAETLANAQARLARAVGIILGMCENTAVIITHGIACSLLLALMDHDEEPEGFANGCLLDCTWDGHTLRLEGISNNELGKA